MRKILGILGPTCVGKSQVGMMLAEKLGVDLISADSAQIYIGMDIGTAKPDKEEQKRVRHRLIDIGTARRRKLQRLSLRRSSQSGNG